MNAARCTIAFALVSAALACSASKGDVPSTDTSPTSPEAAPEAPGPDAGDPPPAKDAGTKEPAPGACSGEPNQAACVTCCTTKHEDGAAIYFVALIDCMCTPANCARECETTLCDPDAPKNADASCQACVQDKSSACGSTIKATCTADPQCVAFDACVGQSDCLGKP